MRLQTGSSLRVWTQHAALVTAVVVSFAMIGSASVSVASPVASARSSVVTTTLSIPRHSAVVAAAKRAADYYRGSYAVAKGNRNGWSWATYFDGLHQTFRVVGDARYLADLSLWGSSNGWQPASVEINPDSVKAAQTYFDVQPLVPTASLALMDSQLNADLTSLPDTQYAWIDALFMGMPNWPRWARRTGDPAYLAKMQALYLATRDNGITNVTGCAGKSPGLYDAAERLWYRDCRFIGERDANGQKIFWARGNAWVIAGMAEVLQSLPAGDPRAPIYTDMLRGMADRLRGLQGSDGFWRSSLLSPTLFPAPETSSTALIAYAIGYGIRSGILDAPAYLPVLNLAWTGLATQALQPSGFLSGCQTVGDRPGAPYVATAPRTVATTTSAGTLHLDSPPFCVGAFLLAASEMSRLTGAMSTDRPTTATGQEVGNEARRAVDGDVTTRWSAKGFPKSLTVDVGRGFEASNAVVTPYLDRAYRYRIETSTDGVSWTRVVDRTSNVSTGSQVTDFSTGPVDVRYARLTVTGAYGASTGWVSIQEFSVHDRYDPRVNAAYRRPTSATSSSVGQPPSNATDNGPGTFWAAVAKPTAAAPQNVTVDLQAVVNVDSVRVSAPAGKGPRLAAVQTSVDGRSWTTVATLTVPDGTGSHDIILPAVLARWVRLQTTDAYGTAPVQVSELEVFAGP